MATKEDYYHVKEYDDGIIPKVAKCVLKTSLLIKADFLQV